MIAEAFITVSKDSNGFCCSFGLVESSFPVEVTCFLSSVGLIFASGACFCSFSFLASSGDNLKICFPLDKRENISVTRTVIPVVNTIPAFDLLINFWKAPIVIKVR